MVCVCVCVCDCAPADQHTLCLNSSPCVSRVLACDCFPAQTFPLSTSNPLTYSFHREAVISLHSIFFLSFFLTKDFTVVSCARAASHICHNKETEGDFKGLNAWIIIRFYWAGRSSGLSLTLLITHVVRFSAGWAITICLGADFILWFEGPETKAPSNPLWNVRKEGESNRIKYGMW